MASPPLRGSPEWSAKRELEVLLGLTRGNYYAAQQLWLQRERYRAEASQVASAGSPQASQQAAGCQAKPATARARDVPRAKPKKSAARLAKDRRRLNQKHLASKMSRPTPYVGLPPSLWFLVFVLRVSHCHSAVCVLPRLWVVVPLVYS